MKNIINRNFVTLLLFIVGSLANAQGTPPPPAPGEEGDIGGISQPIDAYVIWLLIFGIVLIVTALKNKSKQAKNI